MFFWIPNSLWCRAKSEYIRRKLSRAFTICWKVQRVDEDIQKIVNFLKNGNMSADSKKMSKVLPTLQANMF